MRDEGRDMTPTTITGTVTQDTKDKFIARCEAIGRSPEAVVGMLVERCEFVATVYSSADLRMLSEVEVLEDDEAYYMEDEK